MKKAWWRRDADALVAADVTAATAGAAAGGAAGGAVAELVEAVSAGGAGIAGKAVTVALVAGFPSSRTATGAAAREVWLPIKAVVATGGGRGALAADVGGGLSSLALVSSVRSRSRRRLLLEGATQNFVHESFPVPRRDGTYQTPTGRE